MSDPARGLRHGWTRSPRRAGKALVVGALVAALTSRTAVARADDPALPPNHDEFIVVPAIGGNSDIGFQFGASLSMGQFRPGYKPYKWRVGAIAAMSVKDDVRGFRPVQQYHGMRIDIPQFFDPDLRAEFRIFYTRAVDFPWYGVGNRTTRDRRPPPPDAASSNQYLSEDGRFRTTFRINVHQPFDVAVTANLRYEFPDVYPDTPLADEVAAGRVVGDRAAFLETVGAGLYIDRRDNEFVPTRGIFYQIGASETVGTAQSVRFGEVSAVLSHYAPLGTKNLVFASRMIGSYKFGTIPFYELQTGNVFDDRTMVGGNRGVRGIAQGRYAGPLKVVNNNELRATPIPRFHVLHWSVRVGMSAFFDAGRVFSNFAYSYANDGHELGLKVSTGGGFFFQWDEATLFRIEVAYSPDNANRSGIPLAYYFENGILF